MICFMQNSLSKIPVPTWNWLRVNEVMPTQFEGAEGEFDETRSITVAAGQKKDVILALSKPARANINVTVEKGGSLRLITAQLPKAQEAQRTLFAKVEADASIEIVAAELGTVNVSGIEVELAGDNSSAEIYSLYFGHQDDKIDLNYIVRQRGKNTRANIEVRGALSGNSDKIFRGTLDFLEGSAGSEGREKEEVTLFSDTARNRSVPLMLSHEEAVDGHHGVSVGKTDKNKMFYLMSRGLNERDAQKLIVEAAVAPVLRRIDDEELTKEIRKALLERLSNEE